MMIAQVGDADSTRTVYAIIALLVVAGLGLAMVGVWAFRTTRPDEELLGPLELMGQRRWRRSDPVLQRRQLDEVRPDGADPLQKAAAPPDLDAAFDEGPVAAGFEDLGEFEVIGDVTRLAGGIEIRSMPQPLLLDREPGEPGEPDEPDEPDEPGERSSD